MHFRPERSVLVALTSITLVASVIVGSLIVADRDGPEAATMAEQFVAPRSRATRPSASGSVPASGTSPVVPGTTPAVPGTDGAPAPSPDDPAGDRPRDAPAVTAPPATPPTKRDPPSETSFAPLVDVAPSPNLAAPVCARATSPAALTDFFDLGDPLVGADYQRAFPLPDGRVLWLFQDAFLATSGGPRLVHNVGLLQSRRCFQLLRTGTPDAPAPYLLSDLTARFQRWFWPLGGTIGANGDLQVFVAEMREHGSGYLDHTEPVATWLVSIDSHDLTVIEARPAPDASSALYGWSVVSHGDHTYLYGHCYRQFGWDLFAFGDPPFRGHDRACGPNVTLARTPRGQLGAPPEYWDGSAWNTDPGAAVAVIPQDGRWLNPSQVALFDGRFVAVTKVGDWWGDTIYLDVAPTPAGPWRTYGVVTIRPECERCNTYFASIVPYGSDATSYVIGVSTNTWDGDDLEHYTPTFFRVPAPSESGSDRPAGR